MTDGPVTAIDVLFGQSLQERYYEGTVTHEGSGDAVITASDGNDIIAQWHHNAKNVDVIQLNGLAALSDAQLDALFDLSYAQTWENWRARRDSNS